MHIYYVYIINNTDIIESFHKKHSYCELSVFSQCLHVIIPVLYNNSLNNTKYTCIYLYKNVSNLYSLIRIKREHSICV